MSARAAGPRGAWPLGALWLLCVGALIALYAIFVRTVDGQRIDAAAIDGRRFAGARAREAADLVLTTIDVTTLALAVVALVLGALLRRRPTLAALAASVIAGSVLTTEVLKGHLLVRPELVGPEAYDNSFPSGHATIAMAVGLAAVLVVPSSWRRFAALAAIGYAGAVGVAALALGWHRPSDVVGAFCVATGWAAISALAVSRFGGGLDPGGWGDRRRDRRLALAGLGLLGAGYLVAVGVALASRLGSLQLRLIDAAFVGAAVSLIAAAAILVGLLVLTAGFTADDSR